MIISGRSPPLLPSSYVTVINRIDKDILLDILRLKINEFSTLQYVKISIKPKTLFSCYRYNKRKKIKTDIFIKFIKLIIVHRNTEAPS